MSSVYFAFNEENSLRIMINALKTGDETPHRTFCLVKMSRSTIAETTALACSLSRRATPRYQPNNSPSHISLAVRASIALANTSATRSVNALSSLRGRRREPDSIRHPGLVASMRTQVEAPRRCEGSMPKASWSARKSSCCPAQLSLSSRGVIRNASSASPKGLLFFSYSRMVAYRFLAAAA